MEGRVLILPKHFPNIEKEYTITNIFYNSAKFYQTLKGEQRANEGLSSYRCREKAFKKIQHSFIAKLSTCWEYISSKYRIE